MSLCIDFRSGSSLGSNLLFANQRAPKHVSEALIRTKTKTLLAAIIQQKDTKVTDSFAFRCA